MYIPSVIRAASKRTHGFTLIELLIVVAIIAILAAIAVPNFLEAQTRAKIARGKADMRSVATALETYAIDYGKYPFDLDSRGLPWYLTDVMSTPIAYLNGASALTDQFRIAADPRPEYRRYRFVNYKANLDSWLPCYYPGPYRTRWVDAFSEEAYADGIALFGQWKLSSSGPDKTANTNFALAELYYDASNGTISEGDIVLSQAGMK